MEVLAAAKEMLATLELDCSRWTWGAGGAQIAGSVGPKKSRLGTEQAAARWLMPES